MQQFILHLVGEIILLKLVAENCLHKVIGSSLKRGRNINFRQIVVAEGTTSVIGCPRGDAIGVIDMFARKFNELLSVFIFS